MDLLSEYQITEIMNKVDYGEITQEQGLNKFIEYLYEAQFKGQLYLDQNKNIVFVHAKRVEDYLGSSGKWYISMPEGSGNVTEETKISYIQDKLEEDERMIKFLVDEFNEGILLPSHRELFWKKYIQRERTNRIISELDLYTDKYYKMLTVLKDAVTYVWCLNTKNGGISYIKYRESCLKSMFSHNVS
ncbi:hypothetical protein MGH68_18810 [Erysipelothrix sp. D19-032]|uniref:hypothetical protein n=1 Tax=Erysipelothrix anatis TaxID=2683713 RepID=UPI001357E44E|nr:hypothetical protein [Erysipelothrix anatis]